MNLLIKGQTFAFVPSGKTKPFKHLEDRILHRTDILIFDCHDGLLNLLASKENIDFCKEKTVWIGEIEAGEARATIVPITTFKI